MLFGSDIESKFRPGGLRPRAPVLLNSEPKTRFVLSAVVLFEALGSPTKSESMARDVFSSRVVCREGAFSCGWGAAGRSGVLEMERWAIHAGDARDIDGVNVVVYVLLKVDGRSRRSPREREAISN
jgi:hypothetical protein